EEFALDGVMLAQARGYLEYAAPCSFHRGAGSGRFASQAPDMQSLSASSLRTAAPSRNRHACSRSSMIHDLPMLSPPADDGLDSTCHSSLLLLDVAFALAGIRF